MLPAKSRMQKILQDKWDPVSSTSDKKKREREKNKKEEGPINLCVDLVWNPDSNQLMRERCLRHLRKLNTDYIFDISKLVLIIFSCKKIIIIFSCNNCIVLTFFKRERP